jgi:hypothetical protein
MMPVKAISHQLDSHIGACSESILLPQLTNSQVPPWLAFALAILQLLPILHGEPKTIGEVQVPEVVGGRSGNTPPKIGGVPFIHMKKAQPNTRQGALIDINQRFLRSRS